jgi:hypothetical protein
VILVFGSIDDAVSFSSRLATRILPHEESGGFTDSDGAIGTDDRARVAVSHHVPMCGCLGLGVGREVNGGSLGGTNEGGGTKDLVLEGCSRRGLRGMWS